MNDATNKATETVATLRSEIRELESKSMRCGEGSKGRALAEKLIARKIMELEVFDKDFDG